jgi:hypothetical protein
MVSLAFLYSIISSCCHVSEGKLCTSLLEEPTSTIDASQKELKEGENKD